MNFLEYPKIETLFVRDPRDMKHVTGEVRLQEFLIPQCWFVTEKIDGTNIRLCLDGQARTLDIRGRTDNAQLPPHLLNHLRERFTYETVSPAFDKGTSAVIFGEGYGAKIQKGGGDYNPGPAFRVFDVAVLGERLWWLEWPDVEAVATNIAALIVPVLSDHAMMSMGETVEFVRAGCVSQVSIIEGTRRESEGVVCRTRPLLLMRNGQRLVWKLKTRDFQ